MPIAGPVSIAMATFNGERFLAAQLQSLADQDMLPAELVVCDDLSTDATVDIVTAFAAHAPFAVRLYRNETRLRFSDNFIKAIGLCRERYIAFCDQDDLWHPDKVRKSVERLQSSGALMCAHRVDLIDRSGTRFGSALNRSHALMLHGSACSPWGVFLGFTCTIDRRLSDLIDPALRPPDLIEYDRPMSHDRWFYFLAAAFGSVTYIDESLAQYRQHDKNVFGRTRDTMSGRARKAARKYPAYIQQRAIIASVNVRLLEHARNIAETDELTDSLGRWHRVADFYAMRQHVLSQPTVYHRLSQLMMAWRGRHYRAAWGCGGAALILQDVIAAVIMR